jgi:cytosine/adenosine deaminase-related metal-dependent hydrolase/uracil-DNA glycosylase
MPTDFCPGYVTPVFAALVRQYPAESVYPRSDFRVEWGPIFHRGRLDGSARVLLIGQDPAAHEDIVRRILVGAAGMRVQGFLAKLGITSSYAMINTFLFSLTPGNSGSAWAVKPAIMAYRNSWIDAILATGTKVEVVLTFGALARKSWEKWASTQPASTVAGFAVAHLTHPTAPDAQAAKDPTKSLAALTKKLLKEWNGALDTLRPKVQHPDVPIPTDYYSDTWNAPLDLVPIPALDLPAGLPAWMRTSATGWAQRNTGRLGIQITAPASAIAAVPAVIGTPVVAAASVAEAHAVAAPALVSNRRPGLSAIRGTIVTMTSGAGGGPLRDHTLYIRDGLIADIRPASAAAPAGFEAVTPLPAGGFVFPGFIELHNHLAFNVLPMWNVPKTFLHRGQWRDHPDYKSLITGPMETIARTEPLMAAVCRYVECKALFGGTTTSQGITLASSDGRIRKHFKGLLRNCESPDDSVLSAASGTISDQAAGKVESFFTTLKKEDSCYLLHLSEGIPEAARKHFLALKRSGKTPRWALTKAFTGIHSTGLLPEDFEVLASFGAAMVWSPLSNLLLYGRTTDVGAAMEAGVTVGLGADWSPSGSKSILGELKVAKAYSDLNGGLLTDEQLLAMVTRDAASILKWDGPHGVGTLERDKIADITVIQGTGSDGIRAVLQADETDVRLVMIGGEPRFGVKELVEPFTDAAETVTVGGKSRRLNLQPVNKPSNLGSPELDLISLSEARRRLDLAFSSLPQLHAAAPASAAIAAHPDGAEHWTLALDEIEDSGVEMRTLMGLPVTGKPGMTKLSPAAALASDVKLKPLRLSPLTVVDDSQWLKGLAKQRNLSAEMKAELKQAYAR